MLQQDKAWLQAKNFLPSIESYDVEDITNRFTYNKTHPDIIKYVQFLRRINMGIVINEFDLYFSIMIYENFGMEYFPKVFSTYELRTRWKMHHFCGLFIVFPIINKPSDKNNVLLFSVDDFFSVIKDYKDMLNIRLSIHEFPYFDFIRSEQNTYNRILVANN